MRTILIWFCSVAVCCGQAFSPFDLPPADLNTNQIVLNSDSFYLNFEFAELTTENLSAGNSGTWSIEDLCGDQAYVENEASHQVNAAPFAPGISTNGFRANIFSGICGDAYLKNVFPTSGLTNWSLAFWVRTGTIYPFTGGYDKFIILADVEEAHEFTIALSPRDAESSDLWINGSALTPNIILTNATWYYLSLKFTSGASSQIHIYNSSGLSVTNIVFTDTSDVAADYIKIGGSSVGGGESTNCFCFDNVLFTSPAIPFEFGPF